MYGGISIQTLNTHKAGTNTTHHPRLINATLVSNRSIHSKAVLMLSSEIIDNGCIIGSEALTGIK